MANRIAIITTDVIKNLLFIIGITQVSIKKKNKKHRGYFVA